MPDHLMSAGPAPKLRPRWRRELDIIRLKGLKRWWNGLWALRRFHRSVDRMVEAEGGGHDH